MIDLAPGVELIWTIIPKTASRDKLRMVIETKGDGPDHLELVFPLNPRATSTCLLPSGWAENDHLRLPAVISAPDLGQMLLSCKQKPGLTARIEGSRANHTVDFIVELPRGAGYSKYTLEFSPVRLPVPKDLKDKHLWPAARRGWFNVFQPSASWGDPGNPFSAPAGVLANNIISDPVSCLICLYGDHALLYPELAPGISAPAMVRRTVDWWLDHRTRPTGEVVAYWDHGDMLDANASPLIAAWDYVEASGDREWLQRRIERLEFIADYLVQRDVDNDGLVESTHSGNYGTLFDPARAGSAWDTINAGHKDSYCNELTYRAWLCLADLEQRLDRTAARDKYV